MQSRVDKDLRGLRVDDRLPYDSQVMKIYNDYEESVFNLSEQSANETIESIKKMSLGQRLKFQQLISARNKRLNTRNNAREV